MASPSESLTKPLISSSSRLAPGPTIVSDLPTPEICVICLDRISDCATALPCRHDHFHFPCLGTWLQHQQRCPLCKDEVRAVRSETDTSGSAVFQLPSDNAQWPRQRVGNPRRQRRGRPTGTVECLARKNHVAEDHTLTFRRHVYTRNLYSLHVGSNGHSRYLPSGSINPALFKRCPQHLSRAKIFIRRELVVFHFLDPHSSAFNSRSITNYRDGSAERPRRRATNSEYLLEYIISFLEAIPLKGSEGQAEILLAEYLGARNARLFLHELESWLRSPYGRLGEWDEKVQYADVRTGSDGGEG